MDGCPIPRRQLYVSGVVLSAVMLLQQCQGFLPATPVARSLTLQTNAYTGIRRSAIEPKETSGAGTGFGADAAAKGRGAKTGTVNKRLLNVIDSELKEARAKNPQPPTPEEEEDYSKDLNGINPLTPLSSAAFAGMVSFLFWRITMGLATAFNNVHLDTDFYPAQRLFNIASTAFVGITALGAGVIGVTAVGLLGLTMRVSLGIMTGELDPNQKKVEPPRSPIPLDAKGLPKITGAWYDVKPIVQQPQEVQQQQQQQQQQEGQADAKERQEA